MKTATRLIENDTLNVLVFDDQTRVIFDESQTLIAIPGEPPRPYEEGEDSEIDAVMNDPTALYKIESEPMDEKMTQLVRIYLGL
ncbi:hypothetical protein [Rhodopirellula halodulae]|uniref:hypothetical protein n=1 Tax=Rhodopirellula halodulae TaxID=2894198 RepID=UPI001E2D5795|nr:hypothetical protein [Rhodopirellula sp. JC737]MCC9655273.1 hypothetical protein [Rhodopirellula sp. JC737]